MIADIVDLGEATKEEVRKLLTQVADSIDDLLEADEHLKLNQFRHQMMLIRQKLDLASERLGAVLAYEALAKQEAADAEQVRRLRERR